MSGFMYITSLTIFMGTILFVFAIRGWAAIQQAKARLANDEGYRKLAETAAEAGVKAAASLAAIQDSVNEIQTRLTAIETVLKTVE